MKKQQPTKAPAKHMANPKMPKASKQPLLYAAFCAVFAFLLYVNTIGNEYVLDDEIVITKNEFVQQGIQGIPSILTVDMWHFENASFGYYRPLSAVTFAIEHELSPNNPALSHFINVLLYAFTCFLLCLLLQKVFRNLNPLFSIIVGLIFAAHPLHTEVVANVKSRDELLAFLNMLLSIHFLIKAIDLKESSAKAFILPSIFFYLALLSKETSQVEIILVPLLLLFMYKKSVRELFILMLPLVGVMIVFQLQKFALLGTFLSNQHVDSVSFPYAGTGLELPTMFTIFTYSLRLIFLPHPLSYNYAFNQIPAAEFSDIYTILGIVIFVIGCIVAFMYLKLKSPVGLGIALWWLMLSPALAFIVLKGGIFAERFLYAPVLGFAILITWLLMKVFADKSMYTQTNPKELITNWKLTIPVTVILLLYSIKTIARNNCWHDNMTLFANDVSIAPNSCQTHLHYGTKLIDAGIASQDTTERRMNFNQGIKQLAKAIQINPKCGEAYFTTGYAYHSLEYNFDSALHYYTACIQTTPQMALVYNNLGMLYANIGRHAIASYYFNKTIEVNPFFTEGHRNHERHVRETGFDNKTLPKE